MRINKIRIIIFQLIFCFILNLSTIIFAENNTGDNIENNTNNYTEIFTLDEEKSSIKEGNIDIPIDSVIKLVFTKKISNEQEMIEINKSCITLIDENGNLIDIEIDIKDFDILIKPLNLLEKNKKYTINISEDLQTNDGYLEKQLPIKLGFTTALKDESQVPEEEENIIDKNTLIEKIKEALTNKYNITLEEVEKNKVIILITNEDGTIVNKYIYMRTIEEVKAIIKKLEDEINKPKEPEKKPKPKPDTNLEYTPDYYPEIKDNNENNANKNNGNNIEYEEYDDEKINNDSKDDSKNEKQDESKKQDKFKIFNNLGVNLILCVFLGISVYKIYFSN